MKGTFFKKFILTVFMIPLFFISSSFCEFNEIKSINETYYNSQEEILTSKDIRNKLIATSKEYVGIPYYYGGSGSKHFDCSGLTHFLFSKIDIFLERTSLKQSLQGKRVPISSSQEGDLLFFAINGNIHHVGLIVKKEDNEIWIIHSINSKGVVLEEVLSSNYWSSRIALSIDVISDSFTDEIIF
jgi:cell wall-associated NlpC family hydrolase